MWLTRNRTRCAKQAPAVWLPTQLPAPAADACVRQGRTRAGRDLPRWRRPLHELLLDHLRAVPGVEMSCCIASDLPTSPCKSANCLWHVPCRCWSQRLRPTLARRAASERCPFFSCASRRPAHPKRTISDELRCSHVAGASRAAQVRVGSCWPTPRCPQLVFGRPAHARRNQQCGANPCSPAAARWAPEAGRSCAGPAGGRARPKTLLGYI